MPPDARRNQRRLALVTLLLLTAVESGPSSFALAGGNGATSTIAQPKKPSLRVHPTSAARGGTVTVSGTGCRAGDIVYLISPPFVGNAFVQHSVATRARPNGSFSRRVAIRRSIRAGRYAITARCGGGNLGVAAHLRVR
jgi:hypothetical protein